MERDQKRFNTPWKFAVLAIFLIVGVASEFVPGSGVHARLDAREGIGSASFTASRKFRYGDISAPQLANLNWALRLLPGGELQQRYGERPRIRDVVLGEIMRVADAERVIANAVLAKLSTMDPKAVQASEEKYKSDLEERKKKLNAVKDYWPVITNVKREQTPWGYMLVSYKLKLPQGKKFEFLPCALEYGDNFEPNRGKLEFDCLFMPMRDGVYLARLPDPAGSDLSDVTLKISVDYSRALMDIGADKYVVMDMVTPSIPETATLLDAYSKMKSILDNKAYF
ncbi:hypothetical protein [Pararhizobium sp.]|uniref:hypothetical protein n=1 Tax=Pararhizobium sp. TaxID=1977563 RepID=UPI00271DBEF5|nr:hypothetical protein [Pararhizobium sp.]MDO9418353.1 hypothetical protein [Pararhizobium sp.]